MVRIEKKGQPPMLFGICALPRADSTDHRALRSKRWRQHLCVLGILCVVFQLGMLYSEPHAFASGWHRFLIFVIVGIVIFFGWGIAAVKWLTRHLPLLNHLLWLLPSQGNFQGEGDDDELPPLS